MQLNMPAVYRRKKQKMNNLDVKDEEIESVERLLLPEGFHFAEDAKEVIKCWKSVEVSACPGSGKTTVLLAKLKLLADRMPFENGAGVCVLSHTNVAVDEIKTRLSDYSDKLLSYPNYVGTIQSFIDKFVTLPYLKNQYGKIIMPVNNETYAKHMYNFLIMRDYNTLYRFLLDKCGKGKRYLDVLSVLQNLELDSKDDLFIANGGGLSRIAKSCSKSNIQYRKLAEALIEADGIIKYSDTYRYALKAIESFSEEYTNLFSSRFKYVFVDEYQDCDDMQRKIIDLLFDRDKCILMKIGDPDQAIYKSCNEEDTNDWIPDKDYLSISDSCRFNQELADVLSDLRSDCKAIVSKKGKTGAKPVLIVFDKEKNISKVIDTFVERLDKHSLTDTNGIYKAVGLIRKQSSDNLYIGSYWNGFDSSVCRQGNYSYWSFVEEICTSLQKGKLYTAERSIRRLMCRVFHYINIANPENGRDFTINTVKSFLECKCVELYRKHVIDLTLIDASNIDDVQDKIKIMVNEIAKVLKPDIVNDVFDDLPTFFINRNNISINQTTGSEKNVYIDCKGRRIEFNTIHGVKGETHDATLYLETYFKSSTDLKRVFQSVTSKPKKIKPVIVNNRKTAYVGMSRPRELLCVAIKKDTYDTVEASFKEKWEVVHLS